MTAIETAQYILDMDSDIRPEYKGRQVTAVFACEEPLKVKVHLDNGRMISYVGLYAHEILAAKAREQR